MDVSCPGRPISVMALRKPSTDVAKLPYFGTTTHPCSMFGGSLRELFSVGQPFQPVRETRWAGYLRPPFTSDMGCGRRHRIGIYY